MFRVRPFALVALVAFALVALAPTPASALYSEGGDVRILTAGDFNKIVVKDASTFWLVEFYAPWCGHCKALAPEYDAAAKALRGSGAKLGAVDCDAHKSLCDKYDVRGFPTIKAFEPDRKTSPSPYDGSRDKDGIVAFVKDKLGGGGGPGGGGADDKLAPRLAYADVYNLLHLDATTPRAILVTRGDERVPSWFTSVAVKYKEGKKRHVTFHHARVESDPGVARNFKLRDGDLPAIVFARADGKEGGHYASLVASALGEKAGERIKTTKAFVDAWRANAADAPGASPMPSFPQPRKPRKVADARLAPLSEDNVDVACFGAYKGTCVIAVVDAPAGDEFAEHAALVELSKKYRNDPFSFVWIDAAAQRSFARAFGLRKGDVPALVAVKTGKRNRFAARVGAVDVAGASAFLDKILGGDQQFKPIATLPEYEPEYLRGDADAEEEEEEDLEIAAGTAEEETAEEETAVEAAPETSEDAETEEVGTDVEVSAEGEDETAVE